ncbi:MAG: SIMPL domain-containing protein [Candidatus Woesearchaeota archaeon]
MKNDKTLLVLNLFIGVIILASIFMLQEKEENTITLTGSAEKEVMPDTGVLTFSVVTRDSNVSLAEKRNTEINNRIMETYNATTSNYQISRPYDYEKGLQNSTEYVVRNTIKIRTSEIDKLGETLSGVLDLGANEVQSVRYELSDEMRESVQDSLMAEAVEDAKGKAEELASLSGERIKGVKRIQPQNGNYYPMYDSAARAESADFRPESQDVTYSVNIEYII